MMGTGDLASSRTTGGGDFAGFVVLADFGSVVTATGSQPIALPAFWHRLWPVLVTREAIPALQKVWQNSSRERRRRGMVEGVCSVPEQLRGLHFGLSCFV